ncbi:erythrocyte membrane associated protein 1 [Plasmodium berghei]|uniref:Erythrocyte membrane associated protein 1 n=2 Tax=Plasmodium berghei TaxID=5821 RepID=A0A509AJ70_PLABA|nr:erythrocyte membrane associated protein 1 [Plasmodium berghei ANKA]CXI37531.1 erythrocyte membrane associated protein 1 [Plasmodium berghei]SCM21675.1 erythrocyte membrane associated protein 1 [Plasmodium berghei]SCN24876.1 erythrocyte membrane associated protein 1 [Plasmodium berghei]SCO59991.1 erythrocyte membrane associated protein 1 [Plasmodium berghei]SCO61385.1 erythrocyte membrane associated protein 1 [Plasmodium berghei]|eukprot:XP_034421342.1 erythrocyte membrane associated protein 1 [Plasmodium berghei ANKA]
MVKIHIEKFFFAVNLFLYLSDKCFAIEHASSSDTINEDEKVLVNTTLQETISSNDVSQNNSTDIDSTLKLVSSNFDLPKFASSSISLKNGKSQVCTDPEEIKKVTEIMDEAVYRLKYHSNFNNGYNHYYVGNEELSLCFTEDNGIKFERFHLVIPNPDNYEEIVKMFYTFRGIPYMDNFDFTEKLVHEYYSNLSLMYNSYESRTTPFCGYSFVLSADIQVSEDITMFVQTSVDIDDHNEFDTEKYKNTIVESANSLNIDVYANEYDQMENKTKLFVNLSGIIVKKKSDSVRVTYVNSIHNGDSFPKDFCDKQFRVKNMLYLIDLLKNSFK